MIISEVIVPLLNANEPEARLVGVHVRDGQTVKKGERLFTIETTKAASEIFAPEEGFVRILKVEGATISVGERIAVISENAEDSIDIKTNEPSIPLTEGKAIPDIIRITKPARALAESLGMDLAELPSDRLITEETVRRLAQTGLDISLPASDRPYILVYGAGGHAKSIMEIVFQKENFVISGIVDDDRDLTGKKVLGIPVLGTRVVLPQLIALGVNQAANGVGGILDFNVRIKIFDLLESAGFSFPALVHNRATVEPSAKVADGVQVFANAYVGSEVILEPRCMINTNAVISHDCIIGTYSHIAPGALLAGHVQVGARSLVGMGVTTTIGVRIGDGARIGNGAILLADVPDRIIIQAGRFWTGKAGTA
jgi:sugar O-acyltransferase (sialic acid O-acetyltransferase NeuD family)